MNMNHLYYFQFSTIYRLKDNEMVAWKGTLAQYSIGHFPLPHPHFKNLSHFFLAICTIGLGCIKIFQSF